MKKIHIILFLFLITIIFTNCKEKKYNHSNSENNLYFVFSSFRHGARKAFVKYDVFKNRINNPGTLTKFGAKQHLNIGKKNRQRYYNFLDLGNKTFDTEQIYVRSSSINRTLLSTKKQLQGLLDSSKYNNIIHVIKLVKNIFILYNINITNNTDIFTYYENCGNLRQLSNDKHINEFDYNSTFTKTILPLFQNCYGKTRIKSIFSFCDQVFCSYYEYIYESKKSNKISKCKLESIKTINNFCIKYYDSLRGWVEKYAYYFYSFFRKLFNYMKDAIDGISKLKMIMIGGHDSSVDILMNYLNGLNIVKRTEYPHFAFNIVFELRKYGKYFYIEIYYNDILKYNKTLSQFEHTLNSSKYTDMNIYCKKFHPENFKTKIDENKNIKKVTIKISSKIIILLFLAVLVLINVFLFYVKRKKNKLDISGDIVNEQKSEIKTINN